MISTCFRWLTARRHSVFGWASSAACHAAALSLLAASFLDASGPGLRPATIEAVLLDRFEPPDPVRLEPVTVARTADRQGSSPRIKSGLGRAQGGVLAGWQAPSVELESTDDGAGEWFGPLASRLLASKASRRELAGGSARFYGIEAEGDNFIFVVDRSGSMRGARFRRARGELERSIESLRPTQRYFVIFFSNGAYPMPAPGMLEATPENVRDTIKWLKQIDCAGSTRPLTALVDALDYEPDAVFFLTDGEFHRQVAVEIQARQKLGETVPIHTVGFMDRSGEPLLRAISQLTGGTYRFVH